MATINDIDTVAAVRKYLEVSTIVPKEQDGGDASQETQALLQTIALSFLLFPQMALSLVLQARNSLYQIVTTEIQLVQFIQKTFVDLGSPSNPVTDTSDLVSAQTALVGIDRLGRVDPTSQAYTNFTTAVQSFLDNQLSSSLKRNSRGEFERSGQEAREDLYTSYATLGSLHPVMVQRLKDLLASVSSLQSVDLTKIVASTTVTSLRNSLAQLQTNASVLSKTVLAIELLSGQAALQSISGSRGVYDPLVQTGVLPTGRTITVSSEVVTPKVVFQGTQALPYGSADLTVKVDGEVMGQSLTIPNRVFLFSTQNSGSIVVPASYALYLNWYTTDPSQTTTTKIPITSGTRTRTQIKDDINTVVLPAGIGRCSDINGYFILVGGPTVSKITVLDHGDGSFSSDIYVPSDPSVHDLLGFHDLQATEAQGVLSITGLTCWVLAYLTNVVVTPGTTLTLASPTTGAAGSLVLTGTLLSLYGFTNPLTAEAEPSYLTLQEFGKDLDPATLGITSDCKVTVTGDRGLGALITGITDNQLQFGVPLPRGNQLPVTVVSSLMLAVQGLLGRLATFRSAFDDTLFQFQQVLIPLLSTPTLAQINDAGDVVTNVLLQLGHMSTALQDYQVPDSEQPNLAQLNQLLSGLEERHLDSAMDLLKRGRFSEFFGLTPDSASTGGNFLSAMEQVGQNELAAPTQETAQQDRLNVPVSPNDFVRPGLEVD